MMNIECDVNEVKSIRNELPRYDNGRHCHLTWFQLRFQLTDNFQLESDLHSTNAIEECSTTKQICDQRGIFYRYFVAIYFHSYGFFKILQEAFKAVEGFGWFSITFSTFLPDDSLRF